MFVGVRAHACAGTCWSLVREPALPQRPLRRLVWASVLRSCLLLAVKLKSNGPCAIHFLNHVQ